MPSFSGVVSEGDLFRLVAYIKSLAATGERGHHERNHRRLAPQLRDSNDGTLRSWLLTTDHKRIALLYFASITVVLLPGRVGGGADAAATLISPRGAIVSHETYNRLFTMHGVVMVWFFLVPAVPVTLGNFIVPLMLGARDLAFPRLNLISWYLFIAGGLVVLGAVLGRAGHRLDLLHAALQQLHQRLRRAGGGRHLPLGFPPSPPASTSSSPSTGCARPA